MKYLKMLGLAAVAAIALMAVVGASTASATQLDKVTSGGAKDTLGVGTELHVSTAAGTTLNFTDTAGNPIDTCKESTVKGSIAKPGGDTTTVNVALSVFTWAGCTQTTSTVVIGELEIHGISVTDNGTVTGRNTKWTINVFGVSCVYGFGAGTDLGILTGTTSATGHATMAINAIINEQEPKQFLCPDSSKLTGSYIVTTPTGFYVTP